jgi:hypothetical protein
VSPGDVPSRQEDGVLPTVLFQHVFISGSDHYVLFDSRRSGSAPYLEERMKVLRFLVVGVLWLTVGSFEVSSAQVSSPYAQALDRAKAANELHLLRQKQLIAESDKLLQLSADLQRRIQMTASDRVSVDSLKVASEVEKLAHKLHQLMKE